MSKFVLSFCGVCVVFIDGPDAHVSYTHIKHSEQQGSNAQLLKGAALTPCHWWQSDCLFFALNPHHHHSEMFSLIVTSHRCLTQRFSCEFVNFWKTQLLRGGFPHPHLKSTVVQHAWKWGNMSGNRKENMLLDLFIHLFLKHFDLQFF